MPNMNVKKGDWVDSVCAIEDAHRENLCEFDSMVPGWGEAWVFRGKDSLGVTTLFFWEKGCWAVAPDWYQERD